MRMGDHCETGGRGIGTWAIQGDFEFTRRPRN